MQNRNDIISIIISVVIGNTISNIVSSVSHSSSHSISYSSPDDSLIILAMGGRGEGLVDKVARERGLNRRKFGDYVEKRKGDYDRRGNDNFNEEEMHGLADDFESEYGKGNSWKDRFRIVPIPAWSGEAALSPAAPAFVPFPTKVWNDWIKIMNPSNVVY
ncbi:hypothetical protein [Pelotomaculum sp. FP]|uniref:hypothetical protein n=1 Tax=Pelotomaculum sp. FP TaxID=261474 RepID=UPI001292266F|nr:hypothetical protein [Pelotomaculum sp. FP]